MKLRNQQINFDKRLKDYETKYKEQITILNNIIFNYEEVLESRKNSQMGKENSNTTNNKRFIREFNADISTLTIVNFKNIIFNKILRMKNSVVNVEIQKEAILRIEFLIIHTKNMIWTNAVI